MTNQEFISKIAPIIKKYAKERGYQVASPIIAQACCESNYGRSGLASYHNYFGLKCGIGWKGKAVNMRTKEEYTTGVLTQIRSNFRAYDSMEEGVKGYFDFISTKRYANLKLAKTPLEYLTYIKADGYATSSTYVQTNMNFIKVNNLTQYDDAIPRALPTLKLGDRNDYVRSWQNYLITQGFNIASDGIFGSQTENAVGMWQLENGLKVTGIITPTEWHKIGVH